MCSYFPESATSTGRLFLLSSFQPTLVQPNRKTAIPDELSAGGGEQGSIAARCSSSVALSTLSSSNLPSLLPRASMCGFVPVRARKRHVAQEEKLPRPAHNSPIEVPLMFYVQLQPSRTFFLCLSPRRRKAPGILMHVESAELLCHVFGCFLHLLLSGVGSPVRRIPSSFRKPQMATVLDCQPSPQLSN